MVTAACQRGRGAPWVLICLLLASPARANTQAESIPDLDRAELLSWIDAPAALQLLDKLQPASQTGDALIQWLMARGIASVGGDEKQTEAIAERLHELGRTQASAEAASHLVRAQIDLHKDHYDRGEAELKLVGPEAALPAFERFRLESLRASLNTFLGRLEAAGSDLARARDLANSTHSAPRAFESTIKLVDLYIASGNSAPAASLVAELRTTAQGTGDELELFAVAQLEGNVAHARGDFVEARRGLLEALTHARRFGSERLTVMALLDLSDVELKMRDYADALDHSTRAAALARKLNRPLFERIANFTIGMAQVGLGHPDIGKPMVDTAIQQSLAGGDLINGDDMMRRYRVALEKVGDLRAALEVTDREEAVRDKLAVNAREKALLELSAKFDDERRARRIELLERDNAIKSRDLQAQRSRQQLLLMSAALIVVACGALFWGIVRIRKINGRLLYSIRHDALTGLLNRRYFNEQILTKQADRPYVGCLLLVAVDNTEYINDTWSYSAADAVLGVVSRRLSSALRDSDALVRWESEVFLAMAGPMSDAQLNLAARGLLSAIHGEPVVWNGQDIACTVSIGYANFPVKGAAVPIALERAIILVDKALRQARLQGGDRACLITFVSAGNDGELSAIYKQFEVATADRRVQLVETVGTMA
jgi:diguanylate cyclase (GGDEF)-like protein